MLAKDHQNLGNMRSVNEVWKYRDKEYGRDCTMAAKRIADLHTFQFSKDALTDTLKFEELYQS